MLYSGWKENTYYSILFYSILFYSILFYPTSPYRLAAQAELLVLSSSRRRRIRHTDTAADRTTNSAARRRNSELWLSESTASSSSSSSDTESQRTGTTATAVVRRRTGKAHRQRHRRTEWRKSLPTSLGRRRHIIFRAKLIDSRQRYRRQRLKISQRTQFSLVFKIIFKRHRQRLKDCRRRR